ncbi:MAG: phosphopantetheine-binding protein [Caldilineaceae bacterium]
MQDGAQLRAGHRPPAPAAELEAQVLATIATVLDVAPERVTPAARFREDLGADSLDLAQLIVVLGRTVDLRIEDHEVLTIATVGEALGYLQKRQILR